MSGSEGQGSDVMGIHVASLSDPSLAALLVKASSRSEYRDGYLFFVREGALNAQPLDLDALQLTGQPTVLADKLDYFVSHGGAAFSTGPGRLVYVASPSGQAETVFTLEELTDRSVRFAAPEHDFPQRIVYERVSPRAILAWIEGNVEGVSRVIEFPMVAVRCP